MPHGAENIILTGAHLRAARALLKWTGEQLAQASGVSLQTIRRSEPLDGPVRMITANAWAIRSALEAAGVEFIAENGGGAGVRLRRPFPQR
jgi:hypothetical protein